MLAIFKRELRSYFSTPIGYVFIAVFMVVSGVVFALSTYMADTASLSTYFTMMTVAYVLLIPILTMKIFSDELRSKTQVLILSDTFTQFAAPLMKKLGMPGASTAMASIPWRSMMEVKSYFMRVLLCRFFFYYKGFGWK